LDKVFIGTDDKDPAYRQSLLDSACVMKDYRQVQWLLTNYGDPFVAHRDYYGRNCVSLAATEGASDLLKLPVKHGANIHNMDTKEESH
jgi:hypothetical protein